MKVAFYTTDLYPGRERLMPWRTMIEVSKWINNHTDSECMILDGVHDSDSTELWKARSINYYEHSGKKGYVWKGVDVRIIHAGYWTLATALSEENADCLFMELKWRDGAYDFTPLQQLSCEKYAVFTGGMYDLSSVLMLLRVAGIKEARPYLIESLFPKFLVSMKLKKAGFKKVIGLTPYTTDCAKNACLSSECCITAKDDFGDLVPDYSIVERYGLSNKKWILFTGAPAPTRGAIPLLKAIDRCENDALRVVMLMRTDVGSEFNNLNEVYRNMQHKERVIIINEKLTREQLRAFFGAAYYVALPFIVIPSEIPVTYLEVMSCGTPIITFANGGTSMCLFEGLKIAGKSISGLADTLSAAWNDEEERNNKSNAAIQIMKQHPTWDEIAGKWYNLILSDND